MKKLLLLIASLTLTAPAANAESVWLIITGTFQIEELAIEKIQMKDMDQCEEQAAKWVSSKRVLPRFGKQAECLEGK